MPVPRRSSRKNWNFSNTASVGMGQKKYTAMAALSWSFTSRLSAIKKTQRSNYISVCLIPYSSCFEYCFFFHRSLVLPWITFINDGSILSSSSSSTPPARFHFARNDPQHNIHHIDIMCIFIFEFMLSQASFSIWNIATFHSKLKLGKKKKHRMKPNQARYLVSSQVSLTARTNTPHKKDLSFFAVP